MKRVIASFAAGLVFGLGLCVSQMTNPNKVLSFLDFFGDWDPSLAIVMGAALAVDIVLFRLILKRPRPYLDAVFHMPTLTTIDKRLVAGSAIFGLGWGLAGFCPGAALTATSTGLSQAAIFCVAMWGGMILFRVGAHLFSGSQAEAPSAPLANA